MKVRIADRYLKCDESSVLYARLYLALFFVVAVLSQLFAFEDYPAIISDYGVPLLSALSVPFAVLIVLLEIAAIPSLLGMSLSQELYRFSMIAGWTILVYWFSVGFWQSLSADLIANAGLFGAKVMLPQGWWLVCFIAALIVLRGFVSLAQTTRK